MNMTAAEYNARVLGRGLAEAIAGIAGCPVHLAHHEWADWASMTFEGQRHILDLDFADVTRATVVLIGLPEMEFNLDGVFVADVAGEMVAAKKGRLHVEILVIDE